MKYKFVYKTVTALILSVTSVKTVLAEIGDDDRVSVQYSARPLTLNKNPIITKEDQWWNSYLSSKNNIVQYVHDLSKANPEAAAWFFLTGGKNGFANRQATAEEEKLLLSAVDNIAPTFTKIDSKNEWMTPLRFDNPIGKNHYEIILKKAQQVDIDSVKSVPAPIMTFADQLREMTEKAEKKRQEMWAKVDREREERDRQREEDLEKHLEAMDKNYVSLSRFYTPEGLQKSQQHKKAMQDFRDYYKGLMKILKDKLDYTKESLSPLLGFETSNNAKKLRKVVKLVKEIAKTRNVDSFVFDSKKPSKDALSEARDVRYNKKISLRDEWYAEQQRLRDEWYAEKQRLCDEWYAITTNYKSTEVEKAKAWAHKEKAEKEIWAHKEKAEKEIWAHKEKAEKETDATYSKLEQKLKDERDEASQAETSMVIAQYGSVRKANQERLKAKYAEWQAKRSGLEVLGIETSFEIIQTVNNAFAGLLTTADMRDGIIETLEQRAENLEYEQRGRDILKKWKTKELQVKARLYNKNFRKDFNNDSLNQIVISALETGNTFERIESAIIELLTN